MVPAHFPKLYLCKSVFQTSSVSQFKLFFLLVAFLFNNVLKRVLFRFIKLEGTFSRLNRVQSTNLTYLNKGLANFPILLL